jgi:hypothetical protein
MRQVRPKKKKIELNYFPGELSPVALSVDGLVAAFGPYSIVILDSHTGQLLTTLDAGDDYIERLFFLGDGGLLGAGRALVRWDLRTGRRVWHSEDDSMDGPVFGAVEQDDLLVVAGNNDLTIRTLKAETWQEVSRGQETHEQSVWSVTCLGRANDWNLATVSTDGQLGVWTRTGRLVRFEELAPRALLVVGCVDGSVILFRLPSWEVGWELGPRAPAIDDPQFLGVRKVLFSPDSRFILETTRTRLLVRCAETGECVRFILDDICHFFYDPIFADCGHLWQCCVDMEVLRRVGKEAAVAVPRACH